ncbi:MAG: hypothetical protein H0V44_05180 [Planctomycetes bacterium]|nr:hypothetical protein [Planctomycetota bacterium]
METNWTSDAKQDRPCSSDELKRAADEAFLAADNAVQRLVGSDLGTHLRSAAKHMLQAGVAAINETERKMQERRERAEARSAAEQQKPTASAPAPDRAGNNHAPECL